MIVITQQKAAESKYQLLTSELWYEYLYVVVA
jgi:hypothetical protein